MGKVTGHVGTSATGYNGLSSSPLSINVTCPTGQYPNTKINFVSNGSGGSYSYWKNTHNSLQVTAEIFLCDSSGENKVKLFGFVLNGGGTSSLGKNYEYTNTKTGLAGKALYLIATGTHVEYLRFRGQTDIEVTTSNASYTLTKASSPSGGGTVSGSSSATYNQKVNISASANTGYKFSSWSKSSGTLSSTTTNPTTFTMPAANATVTGNFTANSYSVSKASSPSAGGSITLGATSATYNQKVKITATANTGYSFSSWSKSSGTLSSTTANPSTFTMATSNATVTGNFTANTYTVAKASSPSAGGTVTLGATSGTYNQGIKLTASAATGYSFSSWGKTSGTLSSTTSNPATITLSTSNTTVTGNFTANSYSIAKAVSPSGGGTVTLGASSGTYNQKVNLTASAATGYTFSSWSKSSGTLSSTTTNPTTFTLSTSNATVTGNFTANSYSISSTIVPTGGGTVGATPSSGTYNQKIKLNASPSTGYSFSSWAASSGTLSDASTNPTTLTLANANGAVTANFVANTYTVSKAVDPSGGGSVTLGATSATYNQKVKVTATASTGYSFSSWSASSGTLLDASTTPTTLTLNASNSTVTGNFTKIDYSITTGVDPSGSGTLTASSQTAQIGDTVTLTAIPASNYEFDSYTTNPALTITNDTFTMPASNVTITANFVAVPTYSTCTLDKSAYSGGDIADLEIQAASNSFTHKYKLDFGGAMTTGWVDVIAGVSSVNVLVPVEWCFYIPSGTSVSGGTLVLETYDNGTLVGDYTITGLSYTALDNTIPSLYVYRCDANGNADISGEYGKYSITVPASISTYSLICGQETASSPGSTGDILPGNVLTLDLSNNHDVELEMTYGNETFSIIRDIPKVIIARKIISI